jgi:hypothetical protein
VVVPLAPAPGDRFYLFGECTLCHQKLWASWEEVELPPNSGELVSAWVGTEQEKNKRKAWAAAATISSDEMLDRALIRASGYSEPIPGEKDGTFFAWSNNDNGTSHQGEGGSPAAAIKALAQMVTR